MFTDFIIDPDLFAFATESKQRNVLSPSLFDVYFQLFVYLQLAETLRFPSMVWWRPFFEFVSYLWQLLRQLVVGFLVILCGCCVVMSECFCHLVVGKRGFLRASVLGLL